MKLKTFRRGVHPFGGKDYSRNCPIQPIEPEAEMVFPMSQNLGAPSKPVVAKGDRVLKGQLIAEAGGFIGAPIFSSVSGTVKAIEKRLVINGSKVDSTFAQALAPLNCAETTAFSGESFLWTPGQDPARYDGCRVPEPQLEDKRPVSEIPPEELANAAALIIGEQVSMERYELMKEMSRLFGFPRMTSNNEPLLAEGINLAVSLGKVSAPSEDRVTAI